MKKRFLALLAAGALLLTGCGAQGAANSNAEAGGDGGAEDNLHHLTVVLDWYPNALHAFLYEAQEKGYFAEQGLDVDIQSPAGVNDAMSMVAAGKADIGLYYQQDVIQARSEQNVPIKSIGAVVQGPLNIVLSLKDKNITSPKDLEGKTVGYAGTELSEALIRSIMKNSGADPDSVKLVDVGFDLMSSMTTGNVDATIGCLVNHEVPQLEKEGFEDFKNSTDEVLQVLLDNQDEANFALDPDVEKKSCETLLPLMETADAKFLSQTEACWQENIDWMYDEGLISAKPEVSDVMATIAY